MSDKLQELENQIDQIRKDCDNLQNELRIVTAEIARKTQEQETLILAGKDAAKIETELLRLQIHERGIASLIAKLGAKMADNRRMIATYFPQKSKEK